MAWNQSRHRRLHRKLSALKLIRLFLWKPATVSAWLDIKTNKKLLSKNVDLPAKVKIFFCLLARVRVAILSSCSPGLITQV